MNVLEFPPVATLLDLAATGLGALGEVVTSAGAIVLVTLAVRALLIGVGVSMAKAAQGRRRIHPQLVALQQRYRGNPQKLQKATVELYAAENVSPLAGCLPVLAQAPVLMLVYALFASPTIAGHPNALLGDTLFGAPLGRHLLDVASGFQLTALVFPVLLAVLTLVAWLNRRFTLRDLPEPSPASAATALPGAAALDPRGPLSWMPFAVVLAAAVVPLAATLYLTVSGVWSYAERRILRAIYA